MANTTLRIYRGELKGWSCVALDNGEPLDFTSADITFVVRKKYPPSSVVNDDDALIVKEVGDGITLTDEESGEFDLDLVKEDTYEMAPGGYYYGFEAVMSGQVDPIVLHQGVFSILPDVVRST
jgi:hypothetical protein